MDAIETIERGGYVGTIYADEYAENPREDYDHIAVLTQLSDRFAQPDREYDPSIIDAWNRYGWRVNGVRIHSVELVERYARAFLDAVAVAWWVSPRSSSRVFGYITRKSAMNAGIADPKAVLDAELREYAAWCDGDVYGYTVTAPDGEEIAACWGFYADAGLSYIRDEIVAAIDTHRADVHAERVETFKRLIDTTTRL